MMRPRATGAWLAMGIGLACLLTAGGSMTTTDAVIAYDVTRSLVERGSVAMTGEVAGYEAYRGVDGRYYSPFGIAQSVWNIPFYVGGRAAAGAMGERAAASQTIPKAAVALATVPAVALLGWVCFALLRRLGAPGGRAAATTLLLVFGTPLWPYSGFGFNQPLAALFLWASVLLATGAARGALCAAGACAGLALLTRHEMALAAVPIVLFVAARATAERPARVAAFIAGFLPMAAIWGGLNWWRFGNPLESGYLRDSVPGYGHSVITGGAGLLFSPYASLLLYSPVAVLSVAGWRALWRRDRQAAWLFAALFSTFFLLYASLGNWMGGRSYGPRYLVPLLPALVLPLAFWTPSARWRPAVRALVVLSILAQLPGVLVDYSKVRMEKAAAGETVAQDMRWRAAPILLNARAVVENTRHSVRFLAGGDRPGVAVGDPGLSMALSRSLDFWWLYLAYLGVIGRATALGLAAMLALAAAFALRAAWLSAATDTSTALP